MGLKAQSPRLHDPFDYVSSLTQTHEALVWSATGEWAQLQRQAESGPKDAPVPRLRAEHHAVISPPPHPPLCHRQGSRVVEKWLALGH